MLGESSNYIGLHIRFHDLSTVVPVEQGILATKEVLAVLKIVIHEMIKQFGGHVCVVRTRPK